MPLLARAAEPTSTQPLPLTTHRSPLTFQDRKAILEQALAEFDEGVALSESDPDRAAKKLRAAVDGFERVAGSGAASGPLYYNLGNAYLQLGRLGPAIANYLRAQKLIPGDGNLEANLAYARSQRRNKIAEAGSRMVIHTLFFWHYQLPLRTRFMLALSLYVAFWVVLIVRPYMRQVGLKLAAAVLAVGWITFGTSVGVERGFASGARYGVIAADDVVVRKGNGENYEPQFKQLFYDGVEFKVRERRGDWLHIELPDGNTGWIRSDQAELINSEFKIQKSGSRAAEFIPMVFLTHLALCAFTPARTNPAVAFF